MYVKKMVKEYNGKMILNIHDIEFSNYAAHGIIGKNGAGKTTFLKCLSNIIKPTFYEGDIVLGTYMPENTFVSQYLTGLDYLAYISFFYEGLKGKDILNQYQEEIEMLEFFDFIEKKIITYSYGTLKKLQILSVLLTNRSYLFLDEPFNGLDEDVVKNIWEYLSKIKMKYTIFVSTHNYYSFKKEFDVLWELKENSLSVISKGA